jgi:cell division protein FtsQ
MSTTTAPLPLDIKLMRLATRCLIGVLAVLVIGAMGHWILNHPVWAVRAMVVVGDVSHQNAITLRAQVVTRMRTELGSSFMTLDLERTRELFEAVPWVRQAVVQREFPNRLRITLQEHQAVAWWQAEGSGQLVNTWGEVFDASPDDSDNLPVLAGPPNSAADALRLFKALSPQYQYLGFGLERLVLTERGNWQANLDNGAQVELGRGEHAALVARNQQFIRTVSQVTQRFSGDMQAVDLRYPNGYALSMRGVATLSTPAPGQPVNTR